MLCQHNISSIVICKVQILNQVYIICNVDDFHLISDNVNDVSINALFYLDVFGIKKYVSYVIFSG